MSTMTTKHGLIKPELTDPADITQFNENWDKIDEKLNAIPITNEVPSDAEMWIDPDDNTVEESHINDTNNPHNVTIEQIGAAPSSLGLGNIAYNLTPVTDANAATFNGWYLLEKEAANGFGYRGVLRVDSYSHTQLMQTLYTQGYSTKYPVIVQRTCVNGNWSDWAYVNPVAGVGAEYRTTELHDGKSVYTQLFNLGAVTASGSVNVNIPGLTECIRYAGRIANIPLPVLSTTEIYCDARTNGATIGWVCGHASWVGRTAYCQIWYVKE